MANILPFRRSFPWWSLLALLTPPFVALASDYRDIVSRSGDLGSDGPDSIERIKGLRIDWEGRSIAAKPSYLKRSAEFRGTHQAAAVTWQSTPSLWLTFAASEESNSFADPRVKINHRFHVWSPAAAFKIMDRLILGYRYFALRQENHSSFFHQAGFRWKAESFELAYDQAWQLAPGTKRQSAGIEGRWRVTRTLVGRLHYARETLPWTQVPIPYADRLVTSAGMIAQYAAWTLAGELRREQPEASFAVPTDAVVGSLDYEIAAQYSLGCSITRWFATNPGEGASPGYEIAARLGWRL